MDQNPMVSAGDPGWAAAGISMRQLDYWTRKGYLRAANPNPGIGSDRRWPATEIEVAREMVRLINGGYQVRTAAQRARHAYEKETTP